MNLGGSADKGGEEVELSPAAVKAQTAEPLCRSLTPTYHAAAAAAKSLQSCPTLSDLRDGSPPGSPIPGILQARTLEREGQIESDDTKGRQTISANYLLCDLG